MASPLTERELQIARLVFRYALDTFNESLKAGFDRQGMFEAYYNTPHEELNARITEKVGDVMERMEAARADS